jgi:suppressor for copper-sensitivity B
MKNGWHSLAVLVMVASLATSVAVAQGPPRPDDGPPSPTPKFNLLDQLPGVIGPEDDGPPVFLNARFEIEDGGTSGRLHVTAEPGPGWHVYSTTQPPGGPTKTTLTVNPSAHYKVVGPFTADHPPEVHPSTAFFKDVANQKDPIDEETYEKPVTWSAPIELTKDVSPEKLKIAVAYTGLACKKSCVPVEQTLQATFAGFYTLAKATGEFTAESGHVTWKAHAEPQVATPGSKIKLVFTGTPVEPYHLYAYETKKTKKSYAPTLIAIRSLPAGWKQMAATTDSTIHVKPPVVAGADELKMHQGPVTWTVELAVPEDAAPGKVELQGVLGFQTCTDETCDLPAAAAFRVDLAVDKQGKPGEVLLALEPADYSEAGEVARASKVEAAHEPFSARGLMIAMAVGMLGGLILNVMPCVLPVIPLKLLSFVEQAGKSRARLLSYNLTYSAGSIAVFMVLALIGVVFGLSWGEHFALQPFVIVVSLFLLAMSLSLLGLWEIPLPGAFGSGETTGAEKAGSLTGAFGKGFMTTIYATPCSGPFLGIALAATAKPDFPVYAKFLVFAAVGLGFASPYIIFGLLLSASPKAMRFIPRPGVWMEHVKQALGFLMLAVLVYWYFPNINTKYQLPTLLAAIGVGLGCWIVGKVPVYAETRTKLTGWGVGLGTIALVSWLSFTFLGPHEAILPWQPYSEQALAEARQQGKTVLVDFTADWCPNCQVNSRFAIDTKKVHAVVQKNDVVVLLADWTDRSAMIKNKLRELNSDSIPLLAVYPASGDDPIVLRDLVSQTQVVEALEKAGASSAMASVSEVESKPMTKVATDMR